MSFDITALTSIGWGPFFQQQLTSDEWDNCSPFRVMAVHRGQLDLSMGDRELSLSLAGKMLTGDKDQQATIGDWLLLANSDGGFVRLLDRKSLFKRKAAGDTGLHQLVAANVDSLFIVTSCNDDFNLSRLERYLALAYEAEVTPVIVLTKIDLCETPEDYLQQAESLGGNIMVELVNAKEADSLAPLRNWCKPGQTIALMGSSGVGKSTLANSLGAAQQKTADIREDDARGRHTTTHRSLLPLKDGAILLDSPGIRELQLADSEAGVAAVFADIETLSQQCRFRDCQHDREPACAVQNAIKDESLDPRRLANYNKLMSEQRRHAATLADRRKTEKKLGKHYKSVIAGKKSTQR